MVQVFGCGGEANGHTVDRLVKTSPPEAARGRGLTSDVDGIWNIENAVDVYGHVVQIYSPDILETVPTSCG